jgi:hypothetical protein
LADCVLELVILPTPFFCWRIVPVTLCIGDVTSFAVSNESGSSVSEFVSAPEGTD